MSKIFKTILIISVIVFGVGFLLINSAQAGVVWFGDKNISIDFDELPFDLSNWAPGMSDVKSITIENNENFDINVYLKAKKVSGDNDFADVLTITIDNKLSHLSDLFDDNIALTPVNSGKSQNYNIAISFDEDTGNKYQNKTINFDFIITAEEIGKGGEEISPVIIPGGGGGGSGLPLGLSIYNGTIESVTDASVTINWTTSYAATSQVIYGAEGEAHTLNLLDNTGTPPQYGYAHTTLEYDTVPKVINHSVIIVGLTPGTAYYYRTVSHASLAISEEFTFTTTGTKPVALVPPIIPSAGTGGEVLGLTTGNPPQTVTEGTNKGTNNEQANNEQPGNENPNPTGEVAGEETGTNETGGSHLLWWIIGLIALIIIILLLIFRKKKQPNQ